MILHRESRQLSRVKRTASKTWKLEPSLPATIDELASLGNSLRQRATRGEPLESILPEAYAVVREIADQTIKMRPYDEQIWGAIALHEGKVVEMANGEGKTLTATMPAYLNSLNGSRVHIATYNDYLARRDAVWMGPIYSTLGLSVGVIQSREAYRLLQEGKRYILSSCSRRDAYASNITYGSHERFVFDYLSDNTAWNESQLAQGSLDYIILDEADSVLIDRARTPLTLAQDLSHHPDWYRTLVAAAKNLQRDEDFILHPQIELTQEGMLKAEALLGIDSLYGLEQAGTAHQLVLSIQAIHLYKLDRDYVLRDGRVIPVDEYTGRLLLTSKYPGGLHQAIEAKEGLAISPATRTIAEISYQHFFKIYRKIAGMTGTAQTVEEELREKYHLDVVIIPTHRPLIRQDFPDVIYKTPEAKFQAVVDEVEDCYRMQRPVLIGTTSIEVSEMLSGRLRNRGIPHQVLNAKHDEEEAAIIAQAGRSGVVTVATNMAGRGVDILLGGDPEKLAWENLRKQGADLTQVTSESIQPALAEAKRICAADREKVVALGGLHVIGTDRHEARRIDNQLRGRAGRQGDPGSSRFYVSLEDNVLRRFGGDRIKGIMDWAKMDEDIPLEHALLSRSVETAQRRIEGYNADVRQRLFEYDSVLGKQREFIYAVRRKAVLRQDIANEINTIVDNAVTRAMARFMANKRRPTTWDTKGLADPFCRLSANFKRSSFAGLGNQNWKDVREWLLNMLNAIHKSKRAELGPANIAQAEAIALIRSIDAGWQNHLHRLDTFQQEGTLRSHVEEDPLEWFTMRSNQAFWDTIEEIEVTFLHDLFNVKVRAGGEK